jgi:hypothetical protein
MFEYLESIASSLAGHKPSGAFRFGLRGCSCILLSSRSSQRESVRRYGCKSQNSKAITSKAKNGAQL